MSSQTPRRAGLRAAAGLLALVVALVAVPASAAVAPQSDGGIWGPLLQGEVSKVRQESVLDIFRRAASGSAWLMAEGLDPRLQNRPPWDVLTRLRWRDLETSLADASIPTQAGGGVLVPFRDPAPSFSRNILLSRDLGNVPFQTEPHLAVNPTDPDHVVVGVIDFNLPSIASYVTFDGGTTWEGPFQKPFLRDDLVSGGDPVVAFDRDGNPSMVSISIGLEDFTVGPFVFQAQLSTIAHAVSPDGGMSWGGSSATAQGGVTTDLTIDEAGQVRGFVFLSFLDKPWMAIGPNPADPSSDVIYVTYTNFNIVASVLYVGDIPTFAVTELRTTIELVRSEDGGATWSAPVAVSPTVRRASGEAPGPTDAVVEGLKRVVQGSQPQVAPDGTLYVAWMDSTDDDSQKGLAEIMVARSTDGGRTFSRPVQASLFRETGFRSKSTFFRSWASSFPQMTIGPNGDVYIVYVGRSASKPSDDGDVYFIRSTDGGRDWTRAKRLGGDETDRFQFFPAIDADPNGNLHVIWGDMRDDPSESRYHIYYTTSEDGGDTWGFEDAELGIRRDDTRISDFPSNPNKGFPNGLFIGDYFAVAATEDEVYAVWADTRLGEFGGANQKIAFARRSAIPGVEVFLSPGAGPGGQEVTLQGFNFQPDLDVFVQVGGVTVATQRTNDEGRFTARLFMPVTGEGPQEVRVFDGSGNLATASFFSEFGFGSIRETQEDLDRRLAALTEALGAPEGPEADRLSVELGRVRELLEDRGSSGANVAAVAAAAIGGTVSAAGIGALAYLLWRRRQRPPSAAET